MRHGLAPIGPGPGEDWNRSCRPGPLEPPSPTDQSSPGNPSALSPDPASGAALAAARRELAESQEQLAELEQLIVELPGIFERKFAQRLQPLLERQRLLSEDNHALRERLQRVLPPAQEAGAGPGHLPADREAPDLAPANAVGAHPTGAKPASADQAPIDQALASQNPAPGGPAWRRRLHQATRRLLRRGP